MKLESFIQASGPLFEAVQKSTLFPDAKTFVEQADRKLYLAKDLGRNQVQADGLTQAAA